MPRKYLLILLLSCLVGGSCTVNLVPYLQPTNNKTAYNCTFVKPKDNAYRDLESDFGRVSAEDTVFQRIILFYDSKRIDNRTAYYLIDSSDVNRRDPSIGPKHFLSSAMIFSKDTVLLAPIYKKSDLSSLRLQDFDYSIYPVKKKDTLRFADKTLPTANKQILLCDFRKKNVTINGKKIKRCLYVSIAERWPDATYYGKIWLHKKHGVVKWIRPTGRIEDIEL